MSDSRRMVGWPTVAIDNSVAMVPAVLIAKIPCAQRTPKCNHLQEYAP